jgi:hypothetical protein
MMNNEKLYLRQNIQVEPLIDCWYAWPILFRPRRSRAISQSGTWRADTETAHTEMNFAEVEVPEAMKAARKESRNDNIRDGGSGSTKMVNDCPRVEEQQLGPLQADGRIKP